MGTFFAYVASVLLFALYAGAVFGLFMAAKKGSAGYRAALIDTISVGIDDVATMPRPKGIYIAAVLLQNVTVMMMFGLIGYALSHAMLNFGHWLIWGNIYPEVVVFESFGGRFGFSVPQKPNELWDRARRMSSLYAMVPAALIGALAVQYLSRLQVLGVIGSINVLIALYAHGGELFWGAPGNTGSDILSTIGKVLWAFVGSR